MSCHSTVCKHGLWEELTMDHPMPKMSQVLYLDVAPKPALDQLQHLGDTVISHFRSQGSDIFIEEKGRGFTPHVTVAKTSRLKGRHHHHKHRRGEQVSKPTSTAARALGPSLKRTLI